MYERSLSTKNREYYYNVNKYKKKKLIQSRDPGGGSETPAKLPAFSPCLLGLLKKKIGFGAFNSVSHLPFP